MQSIDDAMEKAPCINGEDAVIPESVPDIVDERADEEEEDTEERPTKLQKDKKLLPIPAKMWLRLNSQLRFLHSQRRTKRQQTRI